ncbi:hypothetical protein Back2_00490 [Nocardioides baekrokdamisoli]|uniref:Uncharacterized protein n=1 Tax=Nocardioides baekrokdamisoli TaxID=1804624 RepID=A0A3G9IBR3_9ACTN|nr:hypothetical protein Back2_00490 [Nocardioides baekrokdamisoli]
MTSPEPRVVAQCCCFTTAARPLPSHGTLDDFVKELESAVAVIERADDDPSRLRCNAVIFGNCMWDPTWAVTPPEAAPCLRPAEWLTTITGRARHCSHCENVRSPGCWDCEPLIVAFCNRCFTAISEFGPDVTGWPI